MKMISISTSMWPSKTAMTIFDDEDVPMTADDYENW
jgi:hypothetical protein